MYQERSSCRPPGGQRFVFDEGKSSTLKSTGIDPLPATTNSSCVKYPRCSPGISTRRLGSQELAQSTLLLLWVLLFLKLGVINKGHTVHAETPGKTGDTTKDGLESLGKMVRNIILENLNHGNPTGLFIRDLGLSTQSHYIIILDHRSDHKCHRIGKDLGIRIDLPLVFSS